MTTRRAIAYVRSSGGDDGGGDPGRRVWVERGGPWRAEPGNHDRDATSHTSSPIAAAQPLRTSKRALDLTVSRPYTPSPPTGGTDEYRCMVVDPD